MCCSIPVSVSNLLSLQLCVQITLPQKPVDTTVLVFSHYLYLTTEWHCHPTSQEEQCTSYFKGKTADLCYFCCSIQVNKAVNLLLCLIYRLKFIINIHVQKNSTHKACYSTGVSPCISHGQSTAQKYILNALAGITVLMHTPSPKEDMEAII